MPQDHTDQRGKVPLKPFLKDFKSSVSDQELRDRYELTPRSYLNLVKALLDKQIISPEDLARRKEMAVQRDLAKEAKFIAGLNMCSFCGHPSPVPFQECPACGAPAKQEVDAEPKQDPKRSLLTETGGHFYVDDPLSTDEAQPGENEPKIEEEELLEVDDDTDQVEPPEQDEKEAKKTLGDSFRSFFGRKDKG